MVSFGETQTRQMKGRQRIGAMTEGSSVCTLRSSLMSSAQVGKYSGSDVGNRPVVTSSNLCQIIMVFNRHVISTGTIHASSHNVYPRSGGDQFRVTASSYVTPAATRYRLLLIQRRRGRLEAWGARASTIGLTWSQTVSLYSYCSYGPRL